MMRIRRVLLVVDRLKAAVLLRVIVLFLAVGCGPIGSRAHRTVRARAYERACVEACVRACARACV